MIWLDPLMQKRPEPEPEWPLLQDMCELENGVVITDDGEEFESEITYYDGEWSERKFRGDLDGEFAGLIKDATGTDVSPEKLTRFGWGAIEPVGGFYIDSEITFTLHFDVNPKANSYLFYFDDAITGEWQYVAKCDDRKKWFRNADGSHTITLPATVFFAIVEAED